MTILQELDTKEAQYDAHVKRILSNRYVLAWILKNTTEEFKEVSIKQIAEECIAGDISISRIKVMPGQTNVEKEGNEDVEGLFYMDMYECPELYRQCRHRIQHYEEGYHRKNSGHKRRL